MIVGELVETAKDSVSDKPMPSLAAVLAARLLALQLDPLHCMFLKASKFMYKGPRWDLRKLPSYWVDKVLSRPPTEAGRHYQEAEWLLDLLTDGLRTPPVCLV